MRHKWLIGLAVIPFTVPMTLAQTISSYMGDGNDILILCTAPQATKGCVAYLAGVVNSMAGGNSVGGHRACIPKEVVTGQIVDIAVNYLRSHANERHTMAAHLIAAAMAEAFPCSGHR